jgi:hypothetical protein
MKAFWERHLPDKSGDHENLRLGVALALFILAIAVIAFATFKFMSFVVNLLDKVKF